MRVSSSLLLFLLFVCLFVCLSVLFVLVVGRLACCSMNVCAVWIDDDDDKREVEAANKNRKAEEKRAKKSRWFQLVVCYIVTLDIAKMTFPTSAP